MTSRNIRKLCLTVSVAALVGFGAQSGMAQDEALHPSLSITLKQAVATGIATNPEYGVVAASRRATDEELNQGEALFLPSVDLNADAGWEYSEDPATRAGTDDDDDETLFRYETGLTLTQMLFDGWNASYEVDRQQARVVSSANRVRETAELVGLAIVEAYLEVLRQRELLVIARKNVADHIDIMDQIDQGVDGGRSTQADSEQAKARLAQARATESSTRQSLRNAETNYIKEVGDQPGQLTLPATPFDVLAEDVNREVEKTLAYSPTLDIFESDIEVAYAEAQQTKSTMYPQVDLQLNARQGHNLGGVEGRDRSGTALVTMNWNLYRGGADVARAREFIHRHQQTKEARAEAARSVESDVRQTWAAMASAAERAAQFAAQADANVEVVKAYNDQFSLDRRTLLDVLDAQNELFVSRSNTVNSEYLEMLAVYRLLALKGALLPTLEVAYPRESDVAASDLWDYEDKNKAR
ncbi:MAG: TolC family outer membrane protein [Alphaproteobacteria bacterium]|nr:TolC family outer membrane protein [Alphaproteobacteria bacterium]